MTTDASPEIADLRTSEQIVNPPTSLFAILRQIGAAAPAPKTEAPAAEKPAAAAESTAHLITVKSPMVGTFYRSAGPDKAVFVKIGDTIDKGTTVCIIEAMKLFNEIESDAKGKIVKILVEDASPVEYDQPLFLVDPS